MTTPLTLPPHAGRERLAVRRQWLEGRLPGHFLNPEAGPRRYSRCTSWPDLGWLRVTSPAPPPRATTRFLRDCGVRVPNLGAEREGVYLVEDLGDRHLADDPAPTHYRDLLRQWHLFAGRRLPPGHPNAALALDAPLFRSELAQFREEYLIAWRGLDPRGAGAQLARLRQACEWLAEAAAAGPRCLQHRDFHSRNVLLTAHGVALIDHQDLRPGPLYYDLASLLSDAYLDLPGAVEARLETEIGLLGVAIGLDPDHAAEHYWATALQRVLKALGTFGKLLNQGRADYRSAERRARRHALALLGDPRHHRAPGRARDAVQVLHECLLADRSAPPAAFESEV